MADQWIVYLQKFLRALRGACPIILFFLISFAAVYKLSGLQYVIVASVLTVFFQIRHKQNNNTLLRYIRLVVIGGLLVVMAYISSLSFAACVLLNLAIPFILVFTQSSQFNPKGYFSYAMIFVFLSLMPPENVSGLWKELIAFWCCTLFLAASIALYRRLTASTAKAPLNPGQILGEISALIPLLARPERQKELEQRFAALLQGFHSLSYHQKFFSYQTRENQLHDMISTLIQRFSYMIADHEWRGELDEARIQALDQLSAFLAELSADLEHGSHQAAVGKAQSLLNDMNIPEGRVRIFCRSLLHMAVLILETSAPGENAGHPARREKRFDLLRQIKSRLTTESFEMRFAMRLSIVMTVSCAVSYLLPITHSYWIPMNAFLLIQPSYEDSSYRMKTRPIGTLIGCLIEFIAYPLLPGIGGQLLFSLLMISLMYCSMPGTWYQPVFSTCYALTLASMTMNEHTAITLRLVYLGAAVAIVFIVNRFFFPMRRETQFAYSIKALFRLHNHYWDIIRSGLYGLTSLSVSCEILTHFHMNYSECAAYLKKSTSSSRDELREALLILWHMFSELEQMHYLVRTKSIGLEENDAFLRMIDAIPEELYPIIARENFPRLEEELHYQNPDVTYVLTEYLKHAKMLLKYKGSIPF